MDVQVLLKKLNARRTLAALLVAGVAGTIGTLALTQSRAATNAIASELESGTLSTGATKVADQQASGGNAVKFDAVANATVISPSGNDSSGNGSPGAPYKTFAKALSGASAGTTIYARAGTYNEKFTITKSGTPGKPITIASYPGEKAVIVGGQAEYYGQGIIYAKGVHDIVIQDFEVRNITGDGQGIFFQDSSNITIRNNVVHDIQHVAIDVSGNNITVDGNEVYNACLTNANGSYGSGGWPPAVTTKQLTTGASSTNITIRNNYVHDNWGEGIDTWFLNGGTVDNNRSINNYSVNIYSDDSRDIRITNNYVAATNDTHNRRDNGNRPDGIRIASELSKTRPTDMVVDGNTDGGGLNDSFVVHLDGVRQITQSPSPQSF